MDTTNQKSLNEVDQIDNRITRYQLLVKRLRAERKSAVLREKYRKLTIKAGDKGGNDGP